ncbi:MAG: Processive diacylglycerol beta-glucosyltransferase [Anaerolineae bacterium]|nr:Processive diacylglycerol beta-glucosyltransferase [Anaerolineae bacterium]
MTYPPEKKLLILQTGAGGGHMSITQAIKQGLTECAAPIQVATAELLPKQFEELYAIAQRRQFIDVYHLFYKLTDNRYGSQVSSQLNLLLQKSTFKEIIEQHQPDAILSNTQFGIQEIPPVLAEIQQETGKKIPFYVFVPDPFTPHSLCFTPKADLTFVPTIRTLQLALRHRLNPQQIVLTGHPIRAEFYQRPANIARHRAALGLAPEQTTILFGASGDGTDQTFEIISRLHHKLSAPLQALIVTGRNVQLKKRLEKVNFPPTIRPRIFGFISSPQELAALFHASDLVAAKAGPNAVLEATAAGTPFLATHYIKGQETGNKNHIISSGIGFVETKPKRIVHLIQSIVESPELLEPLKEQLDLERTKHQNARAIIARRLVQHLFAGQFEC